MLLGSRRAASRLRRLRGIDSNNNNSNNGSPLHSLCAVFAAVVLIASFLVTSGSAREAHGHECIFNKILSARLANQTGQSFPGEAELQETVADASLTASTARTATTTTTAAVAAAAAMETDSIALRAAAPAGYGALRISVFTADLDVPQRYCSAAGQQRSNYQGGTVICTSDDVFTADKRAVLLNTVVPSAVQMHQDRLYVRPLNRIVSNALAMSTDAACSSFHYPASHTTTGVTQTDFVLYLAVAPTTGATIAWATACVMSSDGRPLVGVANISPKYISATPATIRSLAHEITHALGFSGAGFMASNMLTTVASVRGKSDVTVVASRNVLAKAREHFGCPSLRALELEDAGGTSTAISHWKMRSMKDDLMVGFLGSLVYSAITIAAMEDLGFYKGNYANAEPMAWGKDAGCSLFSEKCIDSRTGVSLSPGMFCTNINEKNVCTPDRLGIGSCALQVYSFALPTWGQYFNGYRNLGGTRAGMDYCPYVDTNDDMDCRSGNEAVMPGSVVASNARCLGAYGGTLSLASGVSDGLKAVCADIQCYKSSRTLRVRLKGMSSFAECPEGTSLDAAVHSSGTFRSGSLLCPSYVAVCGGNVLLDGEAPALSTALPDPGSEGHSTTTPAPTSPLLSSSNNSSSNSSSSSSVDATEEGKVTGVAYMPFTCEREGIAWTQYNRCSAVADNGTRCLGETIQDDDGTLHLSGAGYVPCAVTRCVGWYCATQGAVLVQNQTSAREAGGQTFTRIPAVDPCYCAPLVPSLGLSNMDPSDITALRSDIRVVPGGAGYRADDEACLAAGYTCPDSSTYNVRRRRGRCFCCPHRNQPGYFPLFVQCRAATAAQSS